jgi:uncharacterized protein YndB with AHSA1/START domain
VSRGDVVGEYGTLERVGDVSILRYERHLAHPQQKVWRALTEDAELAAWFPTTIEGERRAGAPLHFAFRQGDGESFDGEMLAFVPPSLLELRWADDVLRFELEPVRDAGLSGCILRLSITFPEYGKAARDAAGWHVCLERLALACDGAALPWQPSERWRVVHRVYVERLGPEASAIGPPREWEQADGPPGRA